MILEWNFFWNTGWIGCFLDFCTKIFGKCTLVLGIFTSDITRYCWSHEQCGNIKSTLALNISVINVFSASHLLLNLVAMRVVRFCLPTLEFRIWKHYRRKTLYTLFFYKQRFFLSQPQCCLTFSGIELQMLLSCCLIYVSIIILRHSLYLIYSCTCLGQGLFMSYLCDLFFIFIFIFIMINHVISWINTRLLFLLIF